MIWATKASRAIPYRSIKGIKGAGKYVYKNGKIGALNMILLIVSLVFFTPNITAQSSSTTSGTPSNASTTPTARGTTSSGPSSSNPSSMTTPSSTPTSNPDSVTNPGVSTSNPGAATSPSATTTPNATRTSPSSAITPGVSATPSAAASTTTSATTPIAADGKSVNPSPLPPAPAETSKVPAPADKKTSTNSTTSNGATTSSTNSEQAKQNTQVSKAEKQKALQDFVKKAADYIKENGKEASLAEFNKKDGIFTKDTLFIFAINYQGSILATMEENQKMLGTNQLNYKDADGVNVVQRLIEKAKSGAGWVRYKAENPVSKTIECKNSYVMPATPGSSDYLIGAGYYYPPNPKTGKCEEDKS